MQTRIAQLILVVASKSPQSAVLRNDERMIKPDCDIGNIVGHDENWQKGWIV